jgi:hypothetical protein
MLKGGQMAAVLHSTVGSNRLDWKKKKIGHVKSSHDRGGVSLKFFDRVLVKQLPKLENQLPKLADVKITMLQQPSNEMGVDHPILHEKWESAG